MIELLGRVAVDVWNTLVATWPFLLVSVVAAVAIDVYVGVDRLAGWLRRRTAVAVVGAVALATATPFCSCGTTAVTLGMIATSTPWAPIVAFMVASPLTSPSEFVLSGGLLGWPFALVFFVGTIVIGLTAGGIAAAAERAGWLDGQARLSSGTCGSACGREDAVTALSVGPGAAAVTELGFWRRRVRLDEFARGLVVVGRRLALYFVGFTALGYLVIEAIPTTWLQQWLGGGDLLGVVVAALLGIPAYVNTEGSLPLLAGLVDGGMGPGPAMAFLVTGAGTSVGAISGMLVIARRRVVLLVVAILLVGAVVLGALTQVLLG